MSFPWNITNPGIWIDGILTSAERTFVTELFSLSPSDGDTFIYDTGTGAWTVGAGGGGASTFLGLTDTPSAYTGQALKILQVNAGETALELVPLSGGGDALTANPLSQFAATTSAQLAGVLSDETGSGSAVFATSPTLVTPTLGVATATSVNKVALTAPATGATITATDGTTTTLSGGTHSGTNTGDQNISNLVTGPASATDNAIARYNGTTGKLVQNSSVYVSDTGHISVHSATSTNASLYVQNDPDGTTPVANFHTNTGAQPFRISRDGGVNQGIDITVDDYIAKFNHVQDETGAESHITEFDITTNSTGTHNYRWSLNGVIKMFFNVALGNLGIGTTSPTATLHLKAGTATASTAPIKLTAGTLNTTPEAGALEFDGTDFYMTV